MTTQTRPLLDDPPSPEEASWLVGQTFDRFVVRRVVGRGGMGLVVEAHDPELDRLVALKLVLDRRASSSAGQRLLREARAMARLSHPNVVQVHEVGTVDGQVFLVMELVRGSTLSQWLAGSPTQAQILEAFAAAGSALHAAHRGGLVHRDFKPSNALVDTDGRVRVTDFGIALQLVGGEPDDPTEPDEDPGFRRRLADLTRTGAAIGTPRYMAPEQRAGGEVTPRSDQYAFCVALWEALYGTHPFEPGDSSTTARASSTDERPAISALPSSERPAAVGGRRAAVPSWLRRLLERGLSPDPAARHASMQVIVTALTHDPSRRARRIVVAGIATAAAITGAVFVLAPRDGASCAIGAERVDEIWNPSVRARMQAAFAASGRPHAATSFSRAAASLDEWQRAWRTGYVDACDDTHVHAAQSESLLDLRMSCLDRRLTDARATVELLAAGGGDAVDRAIEAAATLPSVAPCGDTAALLASVPPPDGDAARAAVAALHARLDVARGLRRLARYAPALEHARGALATASATRYRPAEAEALLVVGQLLADTADRSAVATLREAMHAAAEVDDQRLVVESAGYLVSAMARAGDPGGQTLEVAELAESIAHHARPPVEDQVRLISAIGQSHLAHGKPALARQRFEAALQLAERNLPPDDPIVIGALDRLGGVALAQGKFAEAQPLLERVVAARERVFGGTHPELADALATLGNLNRARGKLPEAKALYERALAIRLAALGPDHPAIAASYTNLGAHAADSGDAETAVAYHTRAVSVMERARGPGHVDVAQALSNLANAEEMRGDWARARALGERALAILEAVHGPDHPLVANVTSNLGVVAMQEGRLDDAVRLFDRAARIAEHVYGPDHPDVADFLENEATVLQQQGKLADAEAMIDRSLQVVAKAFGPDEPRMAMGLVNLANLRVARHDTTGALEAARRGLAIFEAKLGPDHLDTSFAHLIIGDSLVRSGRAAEAIPHIERALAVREASHAQPAYLGEARFHLAKALVAAGRDRARARALATRAQTELAAAKDQAAQVRAWLARN